MAIAVTSLRENAFFDRMAFPVLFDTTKPMIIRFHYKEVHSAIHAADSMSLLNFEALAGHDATRVA